MGIGGGWYEHEWRAYGYGFPAIPQRLGMLREGVEIMHQAWTTGTATLDGDHYQVDGAIVRPLPLQEGGIPFWIAGGGEKVTLKIAARYADYTNFAGSIEEFDRKSDILRGHCDALGRDFAEITRSSNFNTIVGATEAEAADRLAAVKARLLPFVGEKRADAHRARLPRAPTDSARAEQVAERLARRASTGSATRSTTSPRRPTIAPASSSSSGRSSARWPDQRRSLERSAGAAGRLRRSARTLA